MACLIDRVVVNPRYKKIAPLNHYLLYHPTDGINPKQDYYIHVDCGRCINCFRKYMSAWRFRLIHEFLGLSSEQLSRSYFVTLTLSPQYYSESRLRLKSFVRRFLERVRKHFKVSVRHFLVTERGEKRGRLHFHGFFIDLPFHPDSIYRFWKYGFVDFSPCTSRSKPLMRNISYITSYVTKGKKGHVDLVVTESNWPLVLVSPGLGKAYVSNSASNIHHQDGLFTQAFDITRKLRSLPRYLRQKVFTEDELKLLKDDFFDNQSDDVIPDPPYYIGNIQYDDYTIYLRDCKHVQQLYKQHYGK